MPGDDLLDAARAATGIADLERDDDGDVVLRLKDKDIFLHPLPEIGLLLVISPLLAELDESPELLRQLNELNNGSAWVRWQSRKGVVFAELFLSARPLLAGHLEQALRALALATNGVAGELQNAFGGRLPGLQPASGGPVH